jgi:hypothetical protein
MLLGRINWEDPGVIAVVIGRRLSDVELQQFIRRRDSQARSWSVTKHLLEEFQRKGGPYRSQSPPRSQSVDAVADFIDDLNQFPALQDYLRQKDFQSVDAIERHLYQMDWTFYRNIALMLGRTPTLDE